MAAKFRGYKPPPPKQVQLSPVLQQKFQQALALHQNGMITQAQVIYEEILKVQPKHFDALHLLGVCMYQTGQLERAAETISAAIKINPNYSSAHNNRGIALNDLNRLDEALASYDKAISLKPDYAEAYNNSGVSLKDLKRYDEAVASYDKAISLKPDYVEAHYNRGNALKDLKRLDEALASYDKAINLKPDYEWVEGERSHTAMKMCAWTNYNIYNYSLSDNLKVGAKASTPFPVLGLIDSPHLQRSCAETNAKVRHPIQSAILPLTRRVREDKVRVGYYSADFHDHATLYLMAELFEQHNGTEYELHGFSFGPNNSDQMRQRVFAFFSSFQEVNYKSDREVASLSRQLGIDIAVDLKGYTVESRAGIFAERCAPIQVNYLGYPGTMGTDYHDYIIADHTLIPEDSQQFYSEKVVYLPHSYQVNDSKRHISDRTFNRQELGLPDAGFVFCCFNNNWKILPEVFDVWMRLLKAVDGSVLWLLEDNPTAARNLRKEAADRGVDPERLVFAQRMPLDEHLARHRCADLFLDTLPCNAHTTASDALWGGLPILTQIGQSFAARVAASLLNAMDLPELITQSREEYEAKALELALNPDKLAAIKAKVAANKKTSPLFNAKLFARHIEAAYGEMIRRYDTGLKPENIEVSKDGVSSSPDE